MKRQILVCIIIVAAVMLVTAIVLTLLDWIQSSDWNTPAPAATTQHSLSENFTSHREIPVSRSMRPRLGPAFHIVKHHKRHTAVRIPNSGVNWDAVAACESSGHWADNTGNGYFGGLQMNLTFWRDWGGLAYATRPDQAPRAAQIAVATRAWQVRGLQPWPVCGARG